MLQKQGDLHTLTRTGSLSSDALQVKMTYAGDLRKGICKGLFTQVAQTAHVICTG